MQLTLLHDESEEKIGEISGFSPPIPSVGDLVSVTALEVEGLGPDDAEQTVTDETDAYRVADCAIHYFEANADYRSAEDAPEEHLTSQVVLYVVSQEEWADRQDGPESDR